MRLFKQYKIGYLHGYNIYHLFGTRYRNAVIHSSTKIIGYYEFKPRDIEYYDYSHHIQHDYVFEMQLMNNGYNIFKYQL